MAFLPLRSEDLTADTGRCIQQNCALVDEVVARLVAEEGASSAGWRTVGGSGWYGRSADLDDYVWSVSCSCQRRTALAATPLWGHLYGPVWTHPRRRASG